MAKATIFSLAHKGGTGRSLASVNLGYQLSTMGKNVALVDMDLVGGTLHHVCKELTENSVPKVKELEERTNFLKDKLTVSDYLLGNMENEPTPSELYSENLYAKDTGTLSSVIGRKSKKTIGRFTLFPRNPGQEPTQGNLDIARISKFQQYIFDSLPYDFLIIDMQAGRSPSLTRMLETPERDPTHWCIYARATPQQVAGAQELIKFVKENDAQTRNIWLIPTAVMESVEIELSNEKKNLKKLLKLNSKQLDSELISLKDKFGLYRNDLRLGYAYALHCAEGVVTNISVAGNYYEDISLLAKAINDSTDQPDK